MNRKRDLQRLKELGLFFRQIRESMNLSLDDVVAKCDNRSICQQLAADYAITVDNIVHLKKLVPKAVIMKDKTNAEQLRLLSQLYEKHKNIVISIIDTMLTKQKFQGFFQ